MDLNGTGGTTLDGDWVRGCPGPGMGSRPVQNLKKVKSDQTTKGLGHAQGNNEKEKSGTADNGDSAANIVKATGILKQFHHGCDLLDLSEVTVLF
ncbi:hypothetical protein TH25_19620 [Thalassospira profundimaris]|uniref:Uncharacterized protein n=1 Tax=Thalassospira profundimaris TaxID=502049 RepID=A0A367WSL9_9PROT|nr:hypothetical protein TH25_19620 [Thalassospira profundimaris]